MSKINIQASLKNSQEKIEFKGLGIKQNNTIIYKNNNIRTKITIDNIITIERWQENYLKLNLKKGIKLKGTYITKYGNLNLTTETKEIKLTKNSLKTTYILIINDNYIDTFEYILNFSIDS
jgi:hypothetical protein